MFLLQRTVKAGKGFIVDGKGEGPVIEVHGPVELVRRGFDKFQRSVGNEFGKTVFGGVYLLGGTPQNGVEEGDSGEEDPAHGESIYAKIRIRRMLMNMSEKHSGIPLVCI
jgi:hypothetical protein